MQKGNVPNKDDVNAWLDGAMTYDEFAEEDNILKYLDFLFRYTIPMTRRAIIEEALKDNRKGRLAEVPDILQCITPSDHAFALLSLVNHYDDWTGKLDAFIARDKKAMKKIKTKWTQASARNSINTGWQPDAISAFKHCENYFEKFRITKEWGALVKGCAVRMEAMLSDDLDERIHNKMMALHRDYALDNTADPVALELDDDMWSAFVNNGCEDVACGGDQNVLIDGMVEGNEDVDEEGNEVAALVGV